MDFRRDELGLRSETVRRANLSALVRELHEHGALSRSELGVRSGLTRSTVRALIGELAAADLVIESDPGPLGIPGRPSVLVRPNSRLPMAVALDVAVDSIAAAVVGFGGAVLERVRVSRPRSQLAAERTVADLVRLTRRLKAADVGETLGIGVAVVGVVRHADGVVTQAPNLEWHEVSIADELRRSLATELPIFVANEADLGALAESRRGAGRGYQHILFVSGEVGVGGGVIVDGRPLNGAAGFGGEIGHLRLNVEGKLCRCGSAGCWETEIGEDALLAKANRAPGGGRKAVDDVLRDARAGDRTAIKAVEDVGRWLGDGLAGLINVFNPERIILGGLFERLHALVAATVEEQLDRHALAAPRALVSVAPAQLGEDAPLLGAAELAFQPFLTDPAAWIGSMPATRVAAGA